MQAPSTSQRTIQRRSPAADPGPPPNVPARAISPGPGAQSRASMSSAKSVTNGSMSGRRPNPGHPSQSGQNAPPLSQIEKSVTHLLVATKQLLETLTQWSRHQATDAQVSDVYVRLGYEFNIACRAFTAINVDVSDLGNVPELLRHILESTLSQEASVESLERYLPRIRDIIISLLHGLKRKQQKLRQNKSRDNNADPSVPRNTSVSSFSSTSSTGTGLTTLLDQGLANNYSREDFGDDKRNTSTNDFGIPPRMSSASSNRRGLPARDQSRQSVSSEQSSLSSTTMQSIPVLPPYPQEETPSTSDLGDISVDNFPPPPPPPKQQNALAALQRGGDLERRASRRYSAYQISKHLGASPNGVVPMLPPAQNSPIPNRGRNDARESMRAVQNRGDPRNTRQQSSRLAVEVSPTRKPARISEEGTNGPIFEAPAGVRAEDIPTAKTPEDMVRQPTVNFDAPSATLHAPPSDALPMPNTIPAAIVLDPNDKEIAEFPAVPQHQQNVSYVQQSPPQSKGERQFTPELSPPAKELTLFLQYKTKVKKFVLVGGYSDLSIARLQLAFIEKFAWNTHNNGVDLPDIYIQDPVSGVRHELEDLNDIKDRSVLVLNVEVLDEVKRHIDEGLGGIKKIVEGVKTAVDDQQVAIQRVSDRQQDTAKEIARIQAATTSSEDAYVESRTNSALISPSKMDSQAQQRELTSLRRDLAVMRQTYSSFETSIQNSMTTIRKVAGTVKTISEKAALPPMDGNSGRAYVDRGKKTVEEDSDRLVGEVDDLQDMVEDLRKDVVMRGVRPLPRQLETVAKDISKCTMDLTKMQEFMRNERPIWSKIWEKELEKICKDREDITQIEDLMVDLQDDLEKASQTFALVEQATKEQMKDVPGASSTRGLPRSLNHVITTSDPVAAKEGVLGEVRALQPNHENRLEAIERAEKLRQKELESRRGGEFQKELGSFVEEGKLKKSGGFEEVERARKAKDDRIRREVWERQNGITPADAFAAPEDVATEEPAADNPDGADAADAADATNGDAADI